jgi:hypothetical protein
MTKVVIYPQGMPQNQVLALLIIGGEFDPAAELIEDTTGTLVDQFLLFDRAEDFVAVREPIPPTLEPELDIQARMKRQLDARMRSSFLNLWRQQS